MQKKAILVVSFGSSYEETRKQTIDQIEQDIASNFPDYILYRAFTSPRIRQALKRKGEGIDSVEEAMERIKNDGIEDLIVQPTFIIGGKEYDQMYQNVEAFKGDFHSLLIGTPLLYTMEDYFKVATAFTKSLGKIDEEEAIICMGHGTEHFMSVSYAALDYVFKESAHPAIYMATIEAYPGLDQVMGQIKSKSYKKVRIVPFMIVAGHHAFKDMKGTGENAWEYRLQQAGYEVECMMQGLGEIPEIRAIFVEHAKQAKEHRKRVF